MARLIILLCLCRGISKVRHNSPKLRSRSYSPQSRVRPNSPRPGLWPNSPSSIMGEGVPARKIKSPWSQSKVFYYGYQKSSTQKFWANFVLLYFSNQTFGNWWKGTITMKDQSCIINIKQGSSEWNCRNRMMDWLGTSVRALTKFIAIFNKYRPYI